MTKILGKLPGKSNLKYFGLISKINDKFNNQNGMIDIDINRLKKII